MATIPTIAPSELKKRKARNRNFSIDEENIIQSMVGSYSDIINSKFNNEITNRNKAEIWKKITYSVNMKGVAFRTVSQVTEKWGNMTQKAKKCYTNYRSQQRLTGGGPPPTDLSNATSKIIDIMKDTASFNGVPGGIDCIISQTPIDEASTPSTSYQSSCCVTSLDPTQTEFHAVPEASEMPEEGDFPEASVSASSASLSNTSVTPRRKRKVPKCTQQAVLQKQCEVLEGQLRQQELDKEKTLLETQKMRLQIRLLEKILDKQDAVDMGGINASELLLSLMH